MNSNVGNDSDTFIISKEQIEALCTRLRDQDDMGSCIEEVRKMTEIKAATCGWADERTPCCGPSPQIWLYGELQMLDTVFSNLKAGNTDQAILLLNEYSRMLPSNRDFP